jgi:hypothetical protein
MTFDSDVTQPPRTSVPALASTHGRAARNIGTVLVIKLCMVAIVWSANAVLVNRPVAEALAADSRNRTYDITAHYGRYLNPNSLVLDLRSVADASPADLMRGLFTSAEALHQKGRSFRTIALARSGSPVFLMDGTAFDDIGSDYARGENPLYLIRTLPPKLARPDGTRAFGEWEGGALGVMAHEMEDASQAMSAWADGRQMPRQY